MGSLSLIVKATRLCNLRCTYCHDWRAGPNQTMNFTIMARMIASALRDKEHDVVDFIWHGGEPMLLPFSFYEKAMLVQSRFRRPGQVVMNTIQTNGTRLSEPWARFLRDNQFSVGVSLDGPPEIHNKYRMYESGRPSFQDVSTTLDRMRQYGIPFSVLMVIDEDALEVGPKQIFDFFVKMKIKNVEAAAINGKSIVCSLYLDDNHALHHYRADYHHRDAYSGHPLSHGIGE